MLVRSVLNFLILPGVMAGLIPISLAHGDPWRRPGTWYGMPPLCLGLFLLVWCVRDFYTVGRGTLAPWDPPRRLVTIGLYRYSRNPMYLAILTVLVGLCLCLGSPMIAIYAVLLAMAFHLRVLLYEEPVLTRQFPEEWAAYRQDVPRWLWRISAAGGRR